VMSFFVHSVSPPATKGVHDAPSAIPPKPAQPRTARDPTSVQAAGRGEASYGNPTLRRRVGRSTTDRRPASAESASHQT